MTKVNPNNKDLKKSNIFPQDIFKSDAVSFFTKNIEILQQLSKSKFLSFMNKMNPNNGNETKLDIFPGDIFKSDIIFHWSQNTKLYQ